MLSLNIWNAQPIQDKVYTRQQQYLESKMVLVKLSEEVKKPEPNECTPVPDPSQYVIQQYEYPTLIPMIHIKPNIHHKY